MMEQLLEEAKTQIIAAGNLESIENLRTHYLGKTGVLTSEMRKLGSMGEEERKEHGRVINIIKDEITGLLASRKNILELEVINNKLKSEGLDLSLPSKRRKKGSIHPITKAREELSEIFAAFGFEVKEGPSIEDDWHNFTALNIAENHPARQMHDTFYLKGGLLLRTHTSPVQIRTLKDGTPPFKFIAPGRTYRCDSDMTHTPMFHQIEGLLLDETTHLGHLKFIITEFIKQFFEDSKMEFRFRSSFFPFTEPSFEVDIKMSGTNRWLEVLGCGMIHPNVLKSTNIDSEKYRGFAFGLGIERFAMLKYGINDLRQFFESDLRWINHYSFSSYDIASRLGGLTK